MTEPSAPEGFPEKGDSLGTSQRPARFRKKPVEIEAMQWDGSRPSIERLCRWVNDECPRPPLPEDEVADGDPILSYVFTTADDVEDVLIGTWEGWLSVSPGDFIIRGIKGEFYPCKPDVFVASYDLVAHPHLRRQVPDPSNRCDMCGIPKREHDA